jgi:hypothetical protein
VGLEPFGKGWDWSHLHLTPRSNQIKYSGERWDWSRLHRSQPALRRKRYQAAAGRGHVRPIKVGAMFVPSGLNIGPEHTRYMEPFAPEPALRRKRYQAAVDHFSRGPNGNKEEEEYMQCWSRSNQMLWHTVGLEPFAPAAA